MDWNVTTLDWNRRTMGWNVTTLDWNRRTMGWNVMTMDRGLSDWFNRLSADDWSITLSDRILVSVYIVQHFYYPILAIVGVPANLLTIMTLTRRNCGLSKCVTCYLVAMAAADLLIIAFDLILRHIPIVFDEQFSFLQSIHVCNIHAVLLYAATDCSVWFTVTFTFDRFVAICCSKLKSKYCSEKTATVVLGTVTVLSCVKNIFWYFMLTSRYMLSNTPWFCVVTMDILFSPVWITIVFLHNILTPYVPFFLILLFNIFTVKHILVSSRARRRLRAHCSGESPRDAEIASRKKTIILLFVISANFILLWAPITLYSLWWRINYVLYQSTYLDLSIVELGFMLQLLGCCTNTAIYAVTQTQFREQLKNVLKYPFTLVHQFIK
ncbi:probable G-protein coupled receptor 139 [Scyliorhinus canicula]|uniref:probable G-protein coupled receptor 139 n=1 Tax=Scyliorhinus canicula TaxID=7830 RepID=UPI0018F3FA6D|nr:probable G-protein coupled receptor 139 [Scyliorhinus canicula]